VKRTALVLGAGGITGVAWQLGILIGLRRRGVDVARADRIVGTSAGALTGALIATGVEPERAAAVEAHGFGTIRPDWERGAQALALLNDETLDARAIRAGVGSLAVAADVGDEEPYVASMARRLPVHDWPAPGRLSITAVDTTTGDLVVWDGAGSVPLVRAVAASCAVPCVLPAVTVAGQRYMDGGVRSYTNADLVADADAVVVIAPRNPLRARRIATDDEGDPDRVLVVKPDAASVDAVGQNVFDVSRWPPTLGAGIAQGESLASRIAAHLA